MTPFQLGIIFLVFCIFIVIVVYAVKKSNNTKSITYPSKKYMEEIGGKCPDYWTYMGTDSENKVVCKNNYNIPIHPVNAHNADISSKCLDHYVDNPEENNIKTIFKLFILATKR